MNDNRQTFPYEKAVILNALYDAMDALSFTIDSSNSSRGTLIMSSQTFPELGGRIAVSPLLSSDGAMVEVFPKGDGEAQTEWIAELFDEVRSLLERVRLKEEKK
ncbi:MAG TPA: hypothetical protein PLL98_08920 [Bacillota bacterium]|nr:hypothetical protein [Bacillota bacterium]HPL52623.1 hypothetical protein [Bacillota bacterium]